MSETGRIAPSWRTIYHRTIFCLQKRTGFIQRFREKPHQESCNNIRRVWGREGAALSNANIPAMMAILNLMAHVHTKRQS